MEVNFIGGTCIDEFYKLIGESFPIEGQKVLVEYEATKCGGMVSNAASVMSMLGMKSNIIDVLNKNEESSKTILKDLKEYNIILEILPKKMGDNCHLLCANPLTIAFTF